MIRNSTPGPEHRELLVAEKQWKEIVELAFEHLSEILMRVGADGVHRYMESICWYAECHSNTLWNQGGNADYFVPFQIMSIWKGIF